jgi:hypothetical protein
MPQVRPAAQQLHLRLLVMLRLPRLPVTEEEPRVSVVNETPGGDDTLPVVPSGAVEISQILRHPGQDPLVAEPLGF